MTITVIINSILINDLHGKEKIYQEEKRIEIEQDDMEVIKNG